jgi:diaminopimelate epimerase
MNGVKTIMHSVSLGVPHTVLFVDDVAKVNVAGLGREIRRHPHFAAGVNVNFVQRCESNLLQIRTYERGVEAETLACGTGATAAAFMAACLHGFSPPVQARVLSGEILEINFMRDKEEFTDVSLKGPADFVFEGRVEI